MTRQRKRGNKPSTKLPTVWQRFQSFKAGWPPQFGPVQRDAIGLGMLIVSVLTLLGLFSDSSGPILGWWVMLVQRLFGWGAYVVGLAFGLVGIRLMWDKLDELMPIDISQLIGLELLLLVLLVASHIPLVARVGADESFLAASQGRGGGYVGWVLAVPLLGALGLSVGVFLLLLVVAVALCIILGVSWADVKQVLWRQYRLIVAAFSRWRVARQGTPLPPEPEEIPWFRQEPDPEEVKATNRKAPSPKRRRPRRRKALGALPSLDLLDPSPPTDYGDADIRIKSDLIESTLESFGVPAEVVEVNRGPTVTQFGLDPGYIERRSSNGQVQRQRVRVNKIASLEKDLALALAATRVRIEAPVPGQSIVGLEVPNDEISLVSLRGILESRQFKSIASPLALALGEDVSGRAAAIDLGMMPHLLIAGATGSGKSVCINTIICSLLFNNTPQELRMLMVDPKMVELVGYNGVPHLLAPVVTDVEQVVGSLAWIARQMDERYKLFHKVGARHLEDYNQRMSRRKDEESLPVLVVFIDELADMMMVAPDEVERHICRIAQMGRATGIHLAVATQRPSVDVVTGLIKANFPARISFAVTSQTDSRVILDQGGAENLLGRGDMLFMSPQQPAPVRLQGCFVSDEEIGRLTDFWRHKQQAEEPETLFPPWMEDDEDDEADSMLGKAIALVDGRKTISTSYVQRSLRVGYPRAARLVEQMEERGIVGPDEGGGRGRKVLAGPAD
jgi:S-DNA-T family DNA segregation ATPase FtsK/SpoIIIE